MGGKRESLVEWIEYHRMIGIEHFFIYNTAMKSDQHLLASTLSDYISEHLVTLIQWPYQNCVKNFTNGGRSFFYYLNQEREHKDLRVFHPPNPIAQTAALTSCYTRFKHTSKYMIHIDTDEFLAVNPSGSTPNETNSHPIKLEETITQKNLTTFADNAFIRFPNAPALNLRPIMVSYCPHLSETNTPYYRNQSVSSSDKNGYILPRLGRWQQGYHGTLHEGKLIMRTDMVDNFFVHYIAQYTTQRTSQNPSLENNGNTVNMKRRHREGKRMNPKKKSPPQEEENALFLFPKYAVLYHFKQDDPFFLNTLVPNQIPLNETEKLQMQWMTCSFKQQLLFWRKNDGKVVERGNIAHHGLTTTQIEILLNRFSKRML